MTSSGTRTISTGAKARLFRKKFVLQVSRGPDRGRTLTTARERVTIGTAREVDLVLTDPSVSRHHVRVAFTREGFLVTDLGSTNGTSIGNLKIREVVAQGPVELIAGETAIRLMPLAEEEEVDLAEDDHFGAVLGSSTSMRELFRSLKSAAARDMTVLIEGETGTGKELVAHEIHRLGPRRDQPFIVIDCGAIPGALIESELFGHVAGSFTSATRDRAGAFEEAEGGTIFLDEIGELDLSLQPRLLRVLEQRAIKRVGENRHRNIDVRVVAATNRDLSRAVNDGSFRADLFYRLAVVHVRIPPLRERPEDIELLVARMLPEIAQRLGLDSPPLLSAETIQQLVAQPWHGNVRELRNFLERVAALTSGKRELDLLVGPGSSRADPIMRATDLVEEPFKEAKARWTEYFDVTYLRHLLERCDFNVAEASRQSGLDRVHLFRLIKKYRLHRP